MQTAIIIIHILICLFLIVVILLQTGKGGDMGAVFGGSSSTTFGGQGAGTFLSKTTSVVAALFMFTSLALAILSSHVDEASVISDDTIPLQTTTPVMPPAKPRMEPDIEAAKTASTETPVTLPAPAKTILDTNVATGGEKAAPVTSVPETPKPSKAPKDEKTTPAPSSPAL